MKAITISTENSETYSSISNLFIDYYMTEANGEFVKVYLYLIRLLNSNRQVSVAEIADHFNLTEKDICRAIKYWVTKDVLRLTFNGKGQPTGIVVLPLKAPDMALSMPSDVVSLLRSDYMQEEDNDTVDNKEADDSIRETAKGKIVPINTGSFELSAPPKPKFSKKEIDNLLRDEDWEDILYQVETLFGKTVSPTDMQSLLYIYDTLGFNVDLFEYLIEYCTTLGKKNCRYLEATAIGWYQDGITTRTQAKEQYAVMSSVCRIFYQTLGIKRTVPTTIEQEFFKTWTKDFGYGDDIIREACRRAVIHTTNPTIKYVNGILTKWHGAGVKTLSDIEREDKAHADEKAAKTTAQKKSTKTGNGFTDFTQSDMGKELDEMEKLFHQEVNGT